MYLGIRFVTEVTLMVKIDTGMILFLEFSNSSFNNFWRLVTIKMNYGARWLGDIVSNNAFIKAEMKGDDDDYDDDDYDDDDYDDDDYNDDLD